MSLHEPEENRLKGIRKVIGIAWRSIVVGLGYVVTLVATGIVSTMVGAQPAPESGGETMLLLALLSGTMLGLFLGPIAARMRIPRGRHVMVWLFVIFCNMSAVMIEGVFFAPELVSVPLGVLTVQQLLAATVASLLITRLFAVSREGVPLRELIRGRSWTSWSWRVVAGSVTYLVCYFIFGTISYSLVTEPWYAVHSGGLTVPDLHTVIAVEVVRAPLIVLSVTPFVLSLPGTIRRPALLTGLTLFWVGGIVPLVFQIGSLPLALIGASAVEIFFQNLITGGVAASLIIDNPLRNPHIVSVINLSRILSIMN